MTKNKLLIRLGEACLRQHLAKEHYQACYTRMMRNSPGVDGRLRRDQPAQAERIEASKECLEIGRFALEEIRGLIFMFKQKGFEIKDMPRFPKVKP